MTAVPAEQIVIREALGDTVLVEEIPITDRKTKGGIHIPDNADEKWVRLGVVRYVGPGKLLENGGIEPLPLQEGDHVIYDRFTRTCHAPDGAKLRVVPRNELFAVVDVVAVEAQR